MDGEELSDEQVQRLLEDAEQRLRAAKGKKGAKDMPSSTRLPQIATKNTITPYIQSTKQGAQVNRSMLIKPEDRKLANCFRTVVDPLTVKAKAAENAKATAGSDWFNLPRTNLTPELKRDLQLLKMRSVLDPKRFYKKDNSKLQIPEYSQVGTIIEGPTEYFTSRLTNKERKRTLVEEVLQSEQGTKRFKSKYEEIQKAKQSGGKGQYNKLRTQRRKFKT